MTANKNLKRWAVCLASALLLGSLYAPRTALGGHKTGAGRAAEARVFSIEVRGAEISDVLRALAQQSGFNIIIGEGVEGKVTLSLRKISFRDALEMIIKANGLKYTVHNNVFWVAKEVDLSGDLATEIIELNNAVPASAILQVKGTLSPEGTALADERTNSVIIRDLPSNLAKARTLLKMLDSRTPQVVIEARIVEANNNFTRQLGVQWGGSYTSGRDVVTGNALLPLSAGSRNFAVNLPASNPVGGLGIVLGNISNKLFLDIELSAAETRGDLKIISRPRIATLNNQPATIHSGLTFRVKLSQASTGSTTSTVSATSTGGGTLSGLEEIKTGIDLTVTPKISSDGYISMDIETNKSDPDYTHTVDGIPGVSEKSASTHVLVKDGDTIVIGGLYKSSTSDENDAVPLLSRVPVLGALFRSSSRSETREELLVFITPTIVKYETEIH